MTKPPFSPSRRYSPQIRPLGTGVGLGLWLSLACLLMSLLMIVGVILGVSSSYAERHQMTAPEQPTQAIDWAQPAWAVTGSALPRVRSLPSEPPQQHPLVPSLYKQSMRVGYGAYQQQDYHTALINFQRALAERAGDRYATEAIANTEAIIQKQRQDAQLAP